ncbi:MAG: hypothetical protein IPO21_14610 [Bacteroidales bacterium]|nr:hypothetical protein [Bacteroidales bacterium]
MKTQLPIGTIFTYEYIELQVCEGGCNGCYFQNKEDCLGYTKNCSKDFRDKGDSVNYQEVKSK